MKIGLIVGLAVSVVLNVLLAIAAFLLFAAGQQVAEERDAIAEKSAEVIRKQTARIDSLVAVYGSDDIESDSDQLSGLLDDLKREDAEFTRQHGALGDR